MRHAQFPLKRDRRNQNLRNGGHFIASAGGLSAVRPGYERSHRATLWRIIAYVVVALPLLLLIALAWIRS
jgi:hypothetical protein